jgi:hypothetical protein
MMVTKEADTGTFWGMTIAMRLSRSNQYFPHQVVAISTFLNLQAGNLSKHWSFGRGGGDRTKSDVENA